MNTRLHLITGLALAIFSALSVSAQWFGPSPYLSAADSPFQPSGYTSYLHLENFEDGLVNTPGLSIVPFGGPGSVYNSLNTDSVDADDGTIDGSGLAGHSYEISYYNPAINAGLQLNFNAASLGGQLPTDVGFVWTDGVPGPITVNVYDGSHSLVATILSTVGGAGYAGQTDEDRFFGYRYLGGISQVEVVVNTLGSGMEIDHVQYGAAPVPESSTYAAVITLAGLVAW